MSGGGVCGILSFVLVFASCERRVMPEINVLTDQEKQEGWKLLFDGRTTEGWRGFNESGLPDGWVVEDSSLKSLGRGGDIGGDIIYDAEEFDNFELSLEWKLSQGGNSGIFYHVKEGTQYMAAYETGPEYQVIDDVGFPDRLEAWQTSAADYAMYEPDTAKILNPPGEWNRSRILFTPERAEYSLNGNIVLSFVPWSDDWTARKNSGKWKEYPDYGVSRAGYIGLQDHGSVIWYRNIKIRKR